MKIIQKRNYFYFLSGALIMLSFLAVFSWGLNLGIDFTGGVLMEVDFQEGSPEKEDLQVLVGGIEGVSSVQVQATDENSDLIRFSSDDDSKNEDVIDALEESYPSVNIVRVEFISSTISSELKSRAIYAIIIAVIAIAGYIAWAFRKISYPIKSWKYGIGAIVALVHDILITVGFFSVLGNFYGIEIGIPFVAALLTILGYSVNDTIVVYDRIRENLLRAGATDEFEDTVNSSINETLGRSINTSFTVILVLIAIIFLGSGDIKYFALALSIGVLFGTYSSIFVASSFVVELWKRKWLN
ncbi:MAG: protein translocase subunit SecF [Patescibacteria group bacterium]|jgi:preprotein translocase subunit SecF|nr:protein translocase subunit SecF [Patescibacteria group bacterium]